MQDRIQEQIDIFCRVFIFNLVKIPFVLVDPEFVKLYNFLLSPKGGFSNIMNDRLNGGKILKKIITHRRRAKLQKELMGLETMGKNALVEAKKDILWRELIDNPKIIGGAQEVEKKDLKILGVAIQICEKKLQSDANFISINFHLTIEEAEKAIQVGNRIGEFHAEGLAIAEFKQLLELGNKYKKKFPLLRGNNDLDLFIHEAIHFVLAKNGVVANYGNDDDNREFDEGLCSYLHKRFRGGWHTWKMYRAHEYAQYIPFFEERYKRMKESEIGPDLIRNLKLIQKEFRPSQSKLAA